MSFLNFLTLLNFLHQMHPAASWNKTALSNSEVLAVSIVLQKNMDVVQKLQKLFKNPKDPIWDGWVSSLLTKYKCSNTSDPGYEKGYIIYAYTYFHGTCFLLQLHFQQMPSPRL